MQTVLNQKPSCLSMVLGFFIGKKIIKANVQIAVTRLNLKLFTKFDRLKTIKNQLGEGMLKKINLLILIIFLMGCATANNVPEWERIPNKFDGRWELDANNPFYMNFNIKYGKIVGRMGITSWPADIHLPIRGKVSQDGEFKFEYAGSIDVTNGFDLEVKNASAEKGFIAGFAYDDFNKRYTWKVFRK